MRRRAGFSVLRVFVWGTSLSGILKGEDLSCVPVVLPGTERGRVHRVGELVGSNSFDPTPATCQMEPQVEEIWTPPPV